MGISVRKREKQILLCLGVKKKNAAGVARTARGPSRNTFREKVPRIQKETCSYRQKSRQYLPGWSNVSQDVQQKILEQLPILDLMNARLAGLDGGTPQLRCSIQQLMRKRCDQLQPLWEQWKDSSRLKNREYRYGCSPVEFSTVRSFSACHCSISPMKHLWHLRDLKHLSIKFCHLFKPQLEDLGEALRGCSGLLRLSLSSCPYQRLPESIFTLKKLRYLNLSKSLAIAKQLPDDMGERLPQLQFLDLSYCLSITGIPESILVRWETHRKQTFLNGRSLKYSSLRLEGFDSDQKQKLVSAQKYPLLAASI